jgi:hypothetical protein
MIMCSFAGALVTAAVEEDNATEPKSLEELRPAKEIALEMVRQFRNATGSIMTVIDDGEDDLWLERCDERLARGALQASVDLLSRLITSERKAAFEAGRRSMK